jgi:hypothetical protein
VSAAKVPTGNRDPDEYAVGVAFMHPDANSNSIYVAYSKDYGRSFGAPILVAGYGALSERSQASPNYCTNCKLDGLDYRHPSIAYDARYRNVVIAFDDDIDGTVHVVAGTVSDHVLASQPAHEAYETTVQLKYGYHHSPEIAADMGYFNVTYLFHERSTRKTALRWSHGSAFVGGGAIEMQNLHGDVRSAGHILLREGTAYITAFAAVDGGYAYAVQRFEANAFCSTCPASVAARVSDEPVKSAAPRVAVTTNGGTEVFLWSTEEVRPRDYAHGDVYAEIR